MTLLTDDTHRTDLLNRLKRAEGQLRGVQRMLEEGQPCLDIAAQLGAARRALDSTQVRMTVCFMQQELQARLHGQSNAATGPAAQADEAIDGHIESVLEDVQALLSKLR